ncbi:hypothetical protein AVEN_14575-1 [Araneus ventricosus]|uniref:Uncharacterized protein n=1 Tax=Araneus ventricosus TaxID=182803 RepID=A0A4Y2CF79_ARAVE|nr:hypothetical protein AVEN_14575-1 [Araneus ventricosus]
MIGKGAKSFQKFSSMALPALASLKSYDKINGKSLRAITVVANSCMQKAANEEELLTGSSDIVVSGDGTRGYSSLVGVASSEVIDLDVMSSYCQGRPKGVANGATAPHFLKAPAPVTDLTKSKCFLF